MRVSERLLRLKKTVEECQELIDREELSLEEASFLFEGLSQDLDSIARNIMKENRSPAVFTYLEKYLG